MIRTELKFAAHVTTDGKVLFRDRARFDEYVLTRFAGKEIEIIPRLPREERSRQIEKYHWAVQCPLWGAAVGLRDTEAHYDLLARFPVITVDDQGLSNKTSRDMSAEEYYHWVFELVVQGMAENGVICPDPNEIV